MSHATVSAVKVLSGRLEIREYSYHVMNINHCFDLRDTFGLAFGPRLRAEHRTIEYSFEVQSMAIK